MMTLSMLHARPLALRPLVVCVLTLMLGLVYSSGALAAPVIGEPAPQFVAVDTQGNTHRLTDFAGQTVVLEWTNHDCPFVRKHYSSGNMQEQQRMARESHDVVWLTIISSSPGTQGHVSPAKADELTVSRNASPTAVLLDEEGIIGRAYDARVTPHMYIIDASQTLVYMGGIDSNPSARPADIPEATQYVVEALKAMAADQPIAESVTRPYGCSIKYADS